MYDELVKGLRFANEVWRNSPEWETIFGQAADAIEELNKVVKHQAEILHRYGGENGIRQTSETVEVLYKQLAEYRKYDSFLALHGFNFEPPAAGEANDETIYS